MLAAGRHSTHVCTPVVLRLECSDGHACSPPEHVCEMGAGAGADGVIDNAAGVLMLLGDVGKDGIDVEPRGH